MITENFLSSLGYSPVTTHGTQLSVSLSASVRINLAAIVFDDKIFLLKKMSIFSGHFVDFTQSCQDDGVIVYSG